MGAVTGLVAMEFRGKQVGRGRDHQLKAAVGPNVGPVSPARRQFAQDRLRHKIYVPAMPLLKLAPDEGLIAKPRNLF
jgi:hypothetical protein